ncbi:MAG: HPr(Ser) kinase/phosphatase [Oscillospiraceae bacterium]|nr:HPr(Ser) kinase/phosphatase [Oscillospiraceae bacterium]
MENNTSKSVSLNKIISDLSVKPIYLPEFSSEVVVRSKEISRPGLHLIGYFDYFDPRRIQIIGRIEYSYLNTFGVSKKKEALDKFFSQQPCVVMMTKSIGLCEDIIEAAKKHQVPLLSIEEKTSDFLSELMSLLNLEMAPTISIPGGLMEVYGEGILILGESGIGKSETSVELMKRGHRLVADDVVKITKISHNTLIGTSPENIRHFLEIRGIGIINTRQIFGLGSVKIKKSIDLLIKLEKWDQNKNYDRIGTKKTYTRILNIKIPTITLPIRAGRTIAGIIEVAAMNHRQNKMGYSAPEQLLKKLGYQEDFEDNEINYDLDIDKIF